MNNDLTQKTKKGLLTMSASSGIAFVLQFVTTIVLARIFTPNQFGIVSAVTIITSYTDIFWKIGIGPAIVQKKVLNQEDINTGFTVSIILGTIASIVIIIGSPILVGIINIEDSLILKIIAISFIINSLSVVPLSLLQREMNFKVIFKKDIYGSIAYTVAAILLGYIGLGVWGLVSALLIRYLIGSIISLVFCKTKPRLGFNVKSFKSMIHFGFGFSISQFLNVTTSQGDYFVISNKLGTFALGIYGKAYQLMTVPANIVGQVLDDVFFPVMSKIQDDNRQLSNIFILSTAVLAMFFFPIGTAMYLFSEEIILILLGAEWTGATTPLSILSLFSFFRVGYKISDPLFRAKGAVYNRAFIHLINASIVLTTSFIGVNWGLKGVSVGVAFSLIINYSIITIRTYKLIKFDLSNYFYSIIPFMILSGVVIILLKYLEKSLKLLTFSYLTVQIVLIGVFILLMLFVMTIVYKFIWPDSIRVKLSNLLKKEIKRKRSIS